MVAFIAGIMRSLRSEHWRRSQGGPVPRERLRSDQLLDPAADLERSLIAREQLEFIEKLFAEDAVALGLIRCLAEGLSPAQICTALKLSKTDYDSARKRLRRALLKEGLTCGQN
jgi:DNA-directed RNA polymerase specialized sigma24 family protein